MMYDSPILIFDEPTSGLDPVAMLTLKALIQEEKERGKLILVTTHIMQFVEEVADEIVFLLEGKIYFRGPIQALKDRVGVDDLEAAIAGILREHPIVVASPDTTRRISANPIRRKIPGLLTSFKKA
jgi:Cu-processing system ATP-binding protein